MPGVDWRLIYIIEGDDGTREIADTFALRFPRIEILYNSRPSGLGNAFRRAFERALPNADLIVTLDADLNHVPEEIPRLVQSLEEDGADIVIGSRKVFGSTVIGAPFWKTALSGVINRMIRLFTGVPVRDQTSGFRVYRAAVLRNIAYKNGGFAFLPEILIEASGAGYRIVEKPIRFVFRTAGESKMVLLPTARSYLRFFSRAGSVKVIFATLSFSLLALVVWYVARR